MIKSQIRDLLGIRDGDPNSALEHEPEWVFTKKIITFYLKELLVCVFLKNCF